MTQAVEASHSFQVYANSCPGMVHPDVGRWREGRISIPILALFRRLASPGHIKGLYFEVWSCLCSTLVSAGYSN